MDELRWVVGLNFVLAIWIGMLADSWKGRRLYVWMAIGFTTSFVGLLLLVWMPKLKRATNVATLAVTYSSENASIATH